MEKQTIRIATRESDLALWQARHVQSLLEQQPDVIGVDLVPMTTRGDQILARALNKVGYGQGDPKRMLTLVTNPVGAFLAGGQASMETEWKAALERNHGITFDRLFALNNMPISRYLEWLIEKGQVEAYLERLVNAFTPAAIDGLMCRNTISVSWDGRLFDCDFNQMLEMEADVEAQQPEARGTLIKDTDRMHVTDFDLAAWQARPVSVARHCYGCTAGAGSSCGGATT